ncbi:MAG: hypothetical protein M0Q14_01420 [Tissierellaceae bacterium]|nr:hypothetical protein [Tissierellaceae bacterium]
MKSLYVVSVITIIVSFIVNKDKTIKGLTIGKNKFMNILPNYLKLLIIISLVLLLSENFIVTYLAQDNMILGLLSSIIIGSITIMPGFIAYPLAKILLNKGVPYMVVSGFVTSLMLVGLVTYPVEKEYFGRKATILRNIGGITIAALIAIITGILYGEVLM